MNSELKAFKFFVSSDGLDHNLKSGISTDFGNLKQRLLGVGLGFLICFDMVLKGLDINWALELLKLGPPKLLFRLLKN